MSVIKTISNDMGKFVIANINSNTEESSYKKWKMVKRLIYHKVAKPTILLLIKYIGLPILGFTLIAIIIFIIVIIASGISSSNNIKKEIRTEATRLISTDPNILRQEFIIVNNQKYGLPIKKDLTGLQKLMLLGIRIPEWGNRPDNKLDGDLDSFCPYQQRASELMSPGVKQNIVKKYFDYSKTFTADRSQFLHMYKRTQLSLKTDADITFPYGVPHPFTGKHWGTDLGYNYREVATPFDGVVQQIVFDKIGGGNVVVIKHTSNKDDMQQNRTLYAHLDKVNVKEGDKLLAGQIFAISGNSGASSGPHLHLQLMNTHNLGNWNDPNLITNPESQLFMMKIMTNKFVALKQELISVHLRTGFCDELAIQRLYEEPTTFNYLKKDIKINNKDDLYRLLQDLCASQRPHDCNQGVNGSQSWVSRSYNVLSTDDVYKKIQGL